MSLVLGVVEDESTKAILREVVDSIGFELILANSDDPQFPEVRQKEISLVVFDLAAGRDIYDVCHRFRPFCTTPVLVTVDQGNEHRIHEYMKAGATDWIVKPLRAGELTARINAALEKSGHGEPVQLPFYRCKNLTINPKTGKVFKDGIELSLTRTGFRLLVYFMEHKTEIVTKEQLIREVWQHTGGFDDANLVDSAIRRLRKEIEDDPSKPTCIHTIRGVGYRLEEK